MRVIKCDKCGKEMDIPEFRSYELYVRTDDGKEPLDICEKCYKQFINWILHKNTYVSDSIKGNISTNDTMTVRRILEKFEKWYISVDNRAVRDNKFCVFHNDELYTPYSAIDEFLKEEGIEE